MAIKVEILNSELTKAIMSLRKYPLEKQKAVRHELKEMAGRIDKKQKSRLQAYGRVSGKNYQEMVRENRFKPINPDLFIIQNEHIAAPFFEFGTKPHKIRVKNKEVLATRTEYIGGGTANSGSEWTVFGKEVNHPGTRPKPFFYDQAERMAKPFITRLKKLLEIK